jgi:hypothetical protein
MNICGCIQILYTTRLSNTNWLGFCMMYGYGFIYCAFVFIPVGLISRLKKLAGHPVSFAEYFIDHVLHWVGDHFL